MKKRNPHHTTGFQIVSTAAALAWIMAVPAAGVSAATARAAVIKLWEFRADGGVVSPLAVNEHGVCFGSRDHRVYALNRENGDLRWRFKTDGMIRAGACIRSGVVYVGSTDHFLYALDEATGHLRWRFPTLGAIMGPCLATKTRLFFGSNDHHLYCLERTTGRLIWRFKTGDTVESMPATDGHRVFFGSGDNFIYAVDILTGRPVWQHACRAGVDGGLSVYDGILYASSRDGCLYAVEPSGGKPVWRVQTGGSLEAFPIRDHRGNIWLGGGHRNGRVSSISRKGHLLRQKTVPGSVFGPAVFMDGKIWVGSSTGNVHGLSIANGGRDLVIHTGAPVFGGIATYRDTIYWGNDAGVVTASHLIRKSK